MARIEIEDVCYMAEKMTRYLIHCRDMVEARPPTELPEMGCSVGGLTVSDFAFLMEVTVDLSEMAERITSELRTLSDAGLFTREEFQACTGKYLPPNIQMVVAEILPMGKTDLLKVYKHCLDIAGSNKSGDYPGAISGKSTVENGEIHVLSTLVSRLEGILAKHGDMTVQVEGRKLEKVDIFLPEKGENLNNVVFLN